jgi:hypothetical protein
MSERRTWPDWVPRPAPPPPPVVVPPAPPVPPQPPSPPPGGFHIGWSPWARPADWGILTEEESDQVSGLMGELHALSDALAQVVHAGSAAQVAQARQVANRARRAVYRLLAGEVEPRPDEP